jgi:hypothetical protein
MMNFIEPPQNNIPSMDEWNRRRAMMGKPILGGDAYGAKFAKWKQNGGPGWGQAINQQQPPLQPQAPNSEMPITTVPEIMPQMPQNQLGVMPQSPINQPPINTMQPLPKKKPMYGMGYNGPILNNMAVNNGR